MRKGGGGGKQNSNRLIYLGTITARAGFFAVVAFTMAVEQVLIITTPAPAQRDGHDTIRSTYVTNGGGQGRYGEVG